MTMASMTSVALVGTRGHVVAIDATIIAGRATTTLSGLSTRGTREVKDRVRAAVRNSQLSWPSGRVVLDLSPADISKPDTAHDLGIAISVLTAAGTIPAHTRARMVFLGELALDGRLRPVRGVLPRLLAARDAGVTTAIVPA